MLPHYDSTEYLFASKIKQVAMNGLEECNQDPQIAFANQYTKIYDTAQLYMIYSEYRKNNENSYSLAKILFSSAISIKEAAVEKRDISTTYCKIKFIDIITMSNSIMITIAKEDL